MNKLSEEKMEIECVCDGVGTACGLHKEEDDFKLNIIPREDDEECESCSA